MVRNAGRQGPDGEDQGKQTDTPTGHANGHSNGHANGHANRHANGHASGHAHGVANGHANGASAAGGRCRAVCIALTICVGLLGLAAKELGLHPSAVELGMRIRETTGLGGLIVGSSDDIAPASEAAGDVKPQQAPILVTGTVDRSYLSSLSSTRPQEWSAADWDFVLAFLQGPAENRSHVEFQPLLSLMLRPPALDPLLLATTADRRSVSDICASSESAHRCTYGMVSLRSMSWALRGDGPRLTSADELTFTALLAGEDKPPGWEIVHWTQGGWSHMAISAFTLALFVEHHQEVSGVASQFGHLDGHFGSHSVHLMQNHHLRAAVDAASAHMLDFLGRKDLRNLTFIDIGCGTGLNSWAALRAGASAVFCLDSDPKSLQMASRLRERAASFEGQQSRISRWTVVDANIRDAKTLSSWHGRFDLVHSTGFLHRTKDGFAPVADLMRLLRPRTGVMILGFNPLDKAPHPTNLHIQRKRSFSYGHSSHQTRNVLEIEHAYMKLAKAAVVGTDIAAWVRHGFTTLSQVDFWTDVRLSLSSAPGKFLGARALVDFVHGRGLEVLRLQLAEEVLTSLIWQPTSPLELSVAAAFVSRKVCADLPGPWTGAQLSDPSGVGGRVAWKTRLPDWAQQLGEAQQEGLMLLENGRIYGCPHAWSPLHMSDLMQQQTSVYGIHAPKTLTAALLCGAGAFFGRQAFVPSASTGHGAAASPALRSAAAAQNAAQSGAEGSSTLASLAAVTAAGACLAGAGATLRRQRRQQRDASATPRKFFGGGRDVNSDDVTTK
ncbi:unnamed protein product, partial [Polarella glacialis]